MLISDITQCYQQYKNTTILTVQLSLSYPKDSTVVVKMRVLLLLAIALPAALSLEGPCNSYDREKLNEGYYECVYEDPIQHLPTIGVGCNLDKPGARSEIESVGADYDAVLNGSQCLTDSQIEKLFRQDMDTAVDCVSGWVSNWSSIAEPQQSALADMAFNLGCSKLKKFVKMKAAIEKGDYSWAANEMRNSLWCGQVGDRCSRDIDCMKTAY